MGAHTLVELMEEYDSGSSREGVQGARLNPLGLFLEAPGPLLTHLHTVHTGCSERRPTRLNPLAEIGSLRYDSLRLSMERTVRRQLRARTEQVG